MECPESLRCVEVKMDEAGILRKMTRSKPGEVGTEESTELKGREGWKFMHVESGVIKRGGVPGRNQGALGGSSQASAEGKQVHCSSNCITHCLPSGC